MLICLNIYTFRILCFRLEIDVQTTAPSLNLLCHAHFAILFFNNRVATVKVDLVHELHELSSRALKWEMDGDDGIKARSENYFDVARR